MTAKRVFAAILTAASIGTAAEAADDPTNKPSLSDLQKGGHVLYLRHAATDKDYADQVSARMGDCGTQRTLSPAGWRQAQTIGAAVSMHAVPIGAVYSSEYCRAWATAYIAFGRAVQLADLNFEPAEDYTPAQIESMRSRVQPLLRVQPPVGYNTVIVGHDDPFEAATGIYPEPQGVTYVLRPDAAAPSGFTIVGRIGPDEWLALKP